MYQRGWRPFVFALAAVLACSSAARAAGTSAISLQSGNSLVVQVPNLRRVAVGDGKIAGVVSVGNSQVLISGRAPGETTVILWSGAIEHVYMVNVTDPVLDRLTAMIRAAISDPHVSVVNTNTAILVRGTVEDGARFEALSEMLSRFEKLETAHKYTIVNAVTVVHPWGGLQARIDAMDPGGNVRIEGDSSGNAIVSGEVADRVQAEAILGLVRGLAGTYLGASGKIIDRLDTQSVSQVQVKVRILEVDQTGLKQLGIRLQSGTPSSSGLVLGSPSFPIYETARGPGQGFSIGSFYRTIVLAPTIDLMIQDGDAKSLAEPTLTTMPGKEASFLVGGEIPVPLSAGLGAVSIEYKEFGVQLKMTPTILASGAVDTIIAPEVSSLDFADGVVVSGFSIPAIKTSRLSTEVVTKPGESIVMGGLVQHIESRVVQKIPLLGDLPIIGVLFRSTLYQSSNSDVVFVMTPEIVTK
jgi:pilus assembly protein CpaC